MRPGSIFLTVIAIGGMPVVALAGLPAFGFAQPGAVLVAIALTLLAALIVALIWARDLHVLSETVRLVGSDDAAAPPGGRPVQASMERLEREIERLARHMATRTALVERLRRADEAIVERLPDPLIVLGA